MGTVAAKAEEAVETVAEVVEPVKASEKVTLVIDKAENVASDLLAKSTASKVGYLQDVNLTDDEKQQIDDFTKKINIKDSAVILQYGASAQKKIAEFSDTALDGVKTKDLGEVGSMLANLVTELKGFQIEEEQKKGLFGRIKKKVNDFNTLKARYDSAENNVDKITGALETHSNQLQKDIVMLDKMYDTNLVYFKELSMYIIAGRQKLEEEQSTTLVEMKKKAEETGLAEDAQAANDFAALCDRFDKKLYDLELTRNISMQMAPQIRLVQNSDTLMVEKISSTIANTIPLWKNQMVLALGIAHSKQAMEATKEVTDLTNALIKKNADTLKQGTIEIAEQSERGIIDIETVRYSNEQLITSLEEVIRIQDEGRQRRRDAENELGQIEVQLKQKLLDIRNSQNSPV
ncbi:MAG: toxic anion resistance protein [Eubacterium sp.]|nr:toxic anion resistance protein [Eubacterium sp.]